MSKDTGKSTPAKDTPAQSNPLKSLVSDAVAEAQSVAPRKDSGEVVAGPFEVGGTGSVSVVRKTFGNSDKSYLYAEHVPASGGRAKSIPLAAVAVLAEQMA